MDRVAAPRRARAAPFSSRRHPQQRTDPAWPGPRRRPVAAGRRNTSPRMSAAPMLRGRCRDPPSGSRARTQPEASAPADRLREHAPWLRAPRARRHLGVRRGRHKHVRLRVRPARSSRRLPRMCRAAALSGRKGGRESLRGGSVTRRGARPPGPRAGRTLHRHPRSPRVLRVSAARRRRCLCRRRSGTRGGHDGPPEPRARLRLAGATRRPARRRRHRRRHRRRPGHRLPGSSSAAP